MRKQGRTSSYLTGPSIDHTKGTRLGYYVYVEASSGSNFDLATFVSPTIKQASSTCKLNVYVVQGYRMTSVWTLNGDQGNIKILN